MMDTSNYTGDAANTQDAPVMVIVIAVVVGGLISGFCIGVIIYMAWKAFKRNKEDKDKADREGRQGILEESPEIDDNDDEEGPISQARRKNKQTTKKQSRPTVVGMDVEELDNYLNENQRD
jgi:flagellar biosynthesis/type III secretory pathway M-ring protein FliF/YscJ